MALSFDTTSDTIKVISSKDGAITDLSKYKEYLETLDENLLALEPGVEPTRFVLLKVLKYGTSQRVKGKQSRVDEEGNQVVDLGFTLDDVRAALIDVENPGSENLKFSKEVDGLASRQLVANLEALGVVDELFAARRALIKSKGTAVKKS